MSVVSPTAVSDFKRRVSAWAQNLRACPKQIVVMEMRRKWASCSSHGRVCFAKHVLELAPRLQDYIIVHELLHLKHPNHGRVFRSVLAAHLPRWQSFHTKLRRESPGFTNLQPSDSQSGSPDRHRQDAKGRFRAGAKLAKQSYP
ncbi:MAG: M48 family metallopeptidase [Verrucomicrobia bacterium]|nr:M48 family metallopeptidase [Verrucomicrobiota bacterium]